MRMEGHTRLRNVHLCVLHDSHTAHSVFHSSNGGPQGDRHRNDAGQHVEADERRPLCPRVSARQGQRRQGQVVARIEMAAAVIVQGASAFAALPRTTRPAAEATARKEPAHCIHSRPKVGNQHMSLTRSTEVIRM